MTRTVPNLFWFTLLPGVGFWVHLVLWVMDWSVPKHDGSGENWLPVLIQLGLFWLSAAAGGVLLLIAIIQTIRKQTSWYWWLAAIFDLGPAIIFFLVYIPNQLLKR
jgi:hypothetical protein